MGPLQVSGSATSSGAKLGQCGRIGRPPPIVARISRAICESSMHSPERAPAAGKLLAAFASAMRRRRWRWYVFGGQAVLAHGKPRLTADVDVTVDLAGASVHELVGELERCGFELRFHLSKEFLEAARLLPVAHAETGLPIDVVLAFSDLQAEFLDRRVTVDVAGAKVPMISAEDLLATKILAGRRKDLDDARGVLLENEGRLALDRVYDIIKRLDASMGSEKLRRRLDRVVRTLRAQVTSDRSTHPVKLKHAHRKKRSRR